MRFAAPQAFLLLPLLPLVAWFYLRRGRTATVRFSSLRRVGTLGRSVRLRARPLLLVLRLAALALLIVAIARPQTSRSETRVSTEGIALEMVVDRSSSMRAEMDFEGERLNRLEVVKRVFTEFVVGNGDDLPGRPHDLIGMIAFARFADTAAPLVRAHDALVQFVQDTKIAQFEAEDGTAIGDALALAAARLKRAEEDIARWTERGTADAFTIKSKAIILLTDGRNNAGDLTPGQAAALARDWGIKIYAIGIGGGEEFITVQTPFGGTVRLPAVGMGMDEGTLRTVAEVSGGRYFVAADGDALRNVYREIDRLEKTEIETLEFAQHDEVFLPYALAAGLLLLAEIVLGNTWLRRAP